MDNLFQNKFPNFKKYNVMATSPHYMISLIITSNNIPLSLPIILTYCLDPDSSPFQYIKIYLSIIGNRFSYIALLRSIPATILFVRKRFLRHPIIFPFVRK